jgi:mono/diheme cytochrome c family protein
MIRNRLSAVIVLAGILACRAVGQETVTPTSKTAGSTSGEAGTLFFESRVRPILAEHCYRCHGPDSGEGKAKLRVDALESLLRGGESGPAIIRGRPDQSLLILAVRHEGGVSMPPKKKLPQAQIDALTAWVKMGSPWTAAVPGPAPVMHDGDPPKWGESARQFWAFQMPRVPNPPPVLDTRWPRSPIDDFILARLEAEGLSPAPPAERRTLLRRATLDILGIPPSVGEMNAFLGDDSDRAFERVVDRLLASPRYGERWGRHWLDVARYADSNGMDDNLAYSDAWRYRDYVIAAFNSDKPFDRFLEEQIAGDLIADADPSHRDERIVATGFLAIGPKMLAEDDPVKQQMDIVDEQLDTTCRVFLGLTMGCARCHDHKFDPLSIGDYYAMAGIFRSTRTMLSHRVDSKWNTTALGNARQALRLEDLEQIIDRHDNALVNGNPARMSGEERTAHSTLLEEARKEFAIIPKAMAVDEGKVGDLEIFHRGNHLTRGAVVPRRLPTILAGVDQPAFASAQSGRVELARWLTGPRNPLTARVIVNRVWRWHFGQGLVRTVDNLGRLGEPPSHPELLDWLATRFVADGWSLKSLHKRILMSRVYQMSTAWNERAARIDPEDRLLWRMPRRRLEAEELRDALLAVSGELDTTMGGTLLDTSPFQDLSVTGVSRAPMLYRSTRRSVYLPVLRGALYDVFQAFDFPDPAVLSGDRAATTVASQALFMMNGQIVSRASEHLAEALLGDAALGDRDRLQRACVRILGRPADADELSQWESFLARYQAAGSLADESPGRRRSLAWQGLCRALLSSNEFVYVD